MLRPTRRKGAALIICTIFVLVFSAVAVAIASLSGNNLQIAENQRRGDGARGCAESGQEVSRHWLSRVYVPSSTSPSDYLSAIVDELQSDFADNGITNITINADGTIPAVTLDSTRAECFQGQLAANANLLHTEITGSHRGVTRTIRVSYDIEPYEHPIFNYGLATKGALQFPGNPTIRGNAHNWEADIYVESPSSLTAVYSAGNVNFDGDISIGNPAAGVDLQGDVLIAGDHGQTAIDNHVSAGVDPVEFPVADTEPFRQYATGITIDDSTDTSDNMTLSNATIAAGTNPTFAGNIIIEGILFIEAPNIVVFERNVQLNGIIVGNGDPDNPGTNQITFGGNFATGPYPAGNEYDAIRDETGSSILAPGFAASFEGNFSAIDGVMAVSGASFSGNVSAVVKGTIINYSDTPVLVEGNATMVFDRVDSTKVPAGFDFYRVLTYDPSSYSEILF